MQPWKKSQPTCNSSAKKVFPSNELPEKTILPGLPRRISPGTALPALSSPGSGKQHCGNRALHISSVLLVTDKGLRSAGVTSKLEDILEKHNIACVVYDDTRSNPTVDNVEKALKLYHKAGCQALIACGGGSSMDCAKAVGARVAYPKKTVGQMEGILRILRRIPTLIAIPTTAGTGSEVTLAAVITDDKTQHKYPINSFPLIPRYGGGCVNDAVVHLATSEMGFGGVGESGMGAYHGKRGFEAFSHQKSILDKKTWMDLPMRYQPYNRGLYGKLLHLFLK